MDPNHDAVRHVVKSTGLAARRCYLAVGEHEFPAIQTLSWEQGWPTPIDRAADGDS
jgi:hypothetical protein